MIKQEDSHYSQYYGPQEFRNRFLRLQKIVIEAEVDGLLIILGVDSQFDREMQKCANWLLYGLSGHDVSGSPPTEELSDAIFLISKDSFHMLVQGKGYKRMAPLAARISNCNLHSLTPEQELNQDILEAMKVAHFYQMVFDKPKIALPMSSPSDLQKMPLIQAYALDTIGGGFFTMKHNIMNLTEKQASLLTPVYRAYMRHMMPSVFCDFICKKVSS